MFLQMISFRSHGKILCPCVLECLANYNYSVSSIWVLLAVHIHRSVPLNSEVQYCQVLSDEKKRALYDRYGEAGVKSTVGGGGQAGAYTVLLFCWISLLCIPYLRNRTGNIFEAQVYIYIDDVISCCLSHTCGPVILGHTFRPWGKIIFERQRRIGERLKKANVAQYPTLLAESNLCIYGTGFWLWNSYYSGKHLLIPSC